MALPRINLLRHFKFCTKCRQWQHPMAHSRNKSRKDGLSVWCRECERLHKVRKAPRTPWRRRPGRPAYPYTGDIKRSPGEKRRAVAGSELEAQIWSLLTGTLIPMQAIADKLRVSVRTVSRLSEKWYPGRKRRYQWTKYEMKNSPARRGYCDE